MRIFFSSGEASGDAYATFLISEIRKISSDRGLQFTFEGIGGRAFESTGARMVANSAHWGAIGIVEAMKVCPRVSYGYQQAKRVLSTSLPGVFIPIDFGYMNVRLARYAKSKGWRVLYLNPPSSWRRDQQAKDMAKVADVVVTPFDWSEKILREMGATVYWLGHPIKQLIHESKKRQVVSLCENIAVLPGSRAHEIDNNLNPVVDLLQSYGPFSLEFGVAPTISLAELKHLWMEKFKHFSKNKSDRAFFSKPPKFTQGDVCGVFTRARAGIVCSGTATLEAALCGCPHVVVYRGNRLMEIEYKIRRPHIKYISLPNIILDRPIIPELIQGEASAKNIFDHLSSFLEDSLKREEQLAAFEELNELLGGNEAMTKTAELVVRLAS